MSKHGVVSVPDKLCSLVSVEQKKLEHFAIVEKCKQYFNSPTFPILADTKPHLPNTGMTNGEVWVEHSFASCF